ncbi:phage holin [Streptococcus sp. E29BA]|uniref:phage holin n=1 Tax=Streptococcus sp. E29BA TaxID=3278716 RepID=UPI00359DA1CF
MTINWKLRLQNKATLTAIFATCILLAQQLGIKLPDNVSDVVNTVLTLLTLLGVLTDPTTNGLSDSQRALGYDSPKR